jgi:Flp pilus assembly pilin Flp
VIFATRRKKAPGVALIADIHTFAHIRKCRSKGGRGHTSLRIVRGEDGQAMAEYAVILALVAGALILAYTSLGETSVRLFDSVVSQL